MRLKPSTVLNLIYGKEVEIIYEQPYLIYISTLESSKIYGAFSSFFKELFSNFKDLVGFTLKNLDYADSFVFIELNEDTNMLYELIVRKMIDLDLFNENIDSYIKTLSKESTTVIEDIDPTFQLSIDKISHYIISKKNELKVEDISYYKSIIKCARTLNIFSRGTNIDLNNFVKNVIDPSLLFNYSIILYYDFSKYYLMEEFKENGTFSKDYSKWKNHYDKITTDFNIKNMKCTNLIDSMNDALTTDSYDDLKDVWNDKKSIKIYEFFNDNNSLMCSFIVSKFNDSYLYYEEAKKFFDEALKTSNNIERTKKCMHSIISTGKALESSFYLIYLLEKKKSPKSQQGMGYFFKELRDFLQKNGKLLNRELIYIKDLRNLSVHVDTFADITLKEIDIFKTLMAYKRYEIFYDFLKCYIINTHQIMDRYALLIPTI